MHAENGPPGWYSLCRWGAGRRRCCIWEKRTGGWDTRRTRCTRSTRRSAALSTHRTTTALLRRWRRCVACCCTRPRRRRREEVGWRREAPRMFSSSVSISSSSRLVSKGPCHLPCMRVYAGVLVKKLRRIEAQTILAVNAPCVFPHTTVLATGGTI